MKQTYVALRDCGIHPGQLPFCTQKREFGTGDFTFQNR